MASKTWYVLGTAAASPSWNGNLQDGGSAPADAATTFGFAPGKLAIGSYCKARLGASAAATATQTTSYISGASGPAVGTGASITTAGDTFSPLVPYSGTFASGNWTFTWNARAGTVGLVGRLGMRVWASVNADGSSARELTSGEIFSSSVTLSTSANTNWAITWAAPAITLTNEYIFFQLEYQEQTSAGGSNSDNALFRVGGSIVTTNFAALISGSAKFSGAGGLVNTDVDAILLGKPEVLDSAGSLAVNAILAPRLIQAAARFSGGVGLARIFNGTSDLIDLGNSSTLNSTGEMSFSALVYLNGAIPVGHQSWYVSRDSNITGRSFAFGHSTTDPLLMLELYGGGGGVVYGPGSYVALNTWTRVTFTGSSAAGWLAYKNNANGGVQTAGSGLNAAATGSTVLGRKDYAGGADTYLNGCITDVSIWDIILTPTQIAQLVAGQRADTIGANANLKGYWPITGESPEPDKSGNGLNGTLTGTGVVDGPPDLAPYNGSRVDATVVVNLTNAWVNAVIANGGTVSSGRQTLVDNLISGLQADGIWAKLDRLWLFGAENTPSALTDLVGLTLATEANSPTFTADVGYTGADVVSGGGVILTGYDPGASSLWARNDAHFSAWCMTNLQPPTTGGCVIGAGTFGTIQLFVPYTDSSVYCRLNDAVPVSSALATAPASIIGHWVANRTGLNSDSLYQNGSLFGSPDYLSDTPHISGNFVILADASSGYGTPNTISAASMGASLTTTEISNFHTRLDTYLSAIAGAAQASAEFDGSGSLTSSAVLTAAALTLLSGTSSLAVTASLRSPGIALFSGAGSLSVNAAPARAAAAGFAATGSLGVNATVLRQAAALFAGASTLTIDGKVFDFGAIAQFAGTSTLAVAALQQFVGQALFAGAGALAATATQRLTAQALLASAGALAVDATVLGPQGQVWQGAALFAGASTLDADETAAFPGIAAFAGVGGLVTTAVEQQIAAAKLDSSGGLTVNAAPARAAAAGFAGSGGFTAVATVIDRQSQARFAAASTLTSSAVLTTAAAALLSGASSLAVAASLRSPGIAAFSAAGNLNADSYIAGTQQATSRFAGSSSFVAAATVIAQAQTAFSAVGGLVETATLIEQAQARFAATGSLAVSVAAATAAAQLSGSGGLAVVATVIEQAQAGFVAAGALTVNGAPARVAAAGFAGVSSLTAVAAGVSQALVAFSAVGSLNADAFAAGLAQGSAKLAGSGSLAVATTVIAQAQASLAAAGSLAIDTKSVQAAIAKLNGSGSLATAAAIIDRQAQARFAGASTLSASAGGVLANALLAGVGGFSASATRLLLNIPAAAALAAAGSVGANATVLHPTVAANLVAGGSFVARANLIRVSSAGLIGEGILAAEGKRTFPVGTNVLEFDAVGRMRASTIIRTRGSSSRNLGAVSGRGSTSRRIIGKARAGGFR